MPWHRLPFVTQFFVLSLILSLGLISCSPRDLPRPDHSESDEILILSLPEMEAADRDGTPLRVVATTSIIGDVAAQVGGESIDLKVLMGPGQDPHSYEPAARDLTALVGADVILVNGWDLEEGLVDDLVEIGRDVPVVPISANIKPLAFGEDDHQHEPADAGEHSQGGADPHVWFSVLHVKQWVTNLEAIFSALDPDNAETYQLNAAIYQVNLEDLEEYIQSEVAQIPDTRRFLVTNHDSLSYFAQGYGFTVIGAVIPTTSSVAEPSARDIANLIDEMKTHGVCTLITETTVNDALAQTVAAELETCSAVQVLKIFTGAVGPPGSGTDSYIGMLRHNVDTIVAALQ